MNEFKESLKVELGNMQDIPVEHNTEKDYEKWKKARNQKELEKEIWKNAKISKEEQRQIHSELLEELGLR